MKEKILTWAEASDIIVKQIEKVNIGGIVTWFVYVSNYMIYEVDFKSARLKGFHIEAVEVITTLSGKFDGLTLWINENKGE